MKKLIELFKMCVVACFSIILLPLHNCLGQVSSIDENKGRFSDIKDSIIKRELANFTRAGFQYRDTRSSSKVKLSEIPFSYCSDSSIYFEKSNFISMQKMICIKIEKFDTTRNKHSFRSENNKQLWGINKISIPQKNIASVSYYNNIHNEKKIPEEALNDLYEPELCSYTILSDRCKKKVESNCKSFISEDKKRVYIYMLNGVGKNQYEVTWIIVNNKYHSRVVDPLGGSVR